MRTRIVTQSVLRAMSRQHTVDGGSGREREAQPSIDKGKGKAEGASLSPYHGPGMTDEPLSMALEEAISTNLSPVSTRSSLEESNFNSASPISQPPQAHHSAPLRPKPQRLLSQLTRATLPISTGQYASKDRRTTYGGYFSQGESSQAGRSKPTMATNDDHFPDLDPTTGLPVAHRSGSASSNAPSLHLQRTITDLQHSPAKESSSFLPFNIALPRVSIPGLSSGDNGQPSGTRNISTSAPQQDWSSWATSWWSGKSQMDSQLSKEDQADTVEEEAEKHRRKCWSTPRTTNQSTDYSDRTPKNPIVFCHGLLGFDYLGPSGFTPLVTVQSMPEVADTQVCRSTIGGVFDKCLSKMESTSS
jgi:triacylglycerol lipase